MTAEELIRGLGFGDEYFETLDEEIPGWREMEPRELAPAMVPVIEKLKRNTQMLREEIKRMEGSG